MDLDSKRNACRITGFLPLHAVVANSQSNMYDFLADLPDLPTLSRLVANEDAHTQKGSLSQLTGLQLACKLGDLQMFKHLLSRHSSVLWVWGPLTQHRIDLHSIDSRSLNSGANDVMELICKLDATQKTQELLLDHLHTTSYSLLTTHYSLLTTHYSLLTTHYLLLRSCCSTSCTKVSYTPSLSKNGTG